MPYEPLFSRKSLISRRTAVRAGVAASAAVTVGAVSAAHGAAQEATPPAMGMATEHLEVEVVVANPVTITLAGGGPPQRGDHFYIDGPIYASGDAGGTPIGQYNCFGAWTTAADDTSATYQRLTTVQFRLEDGSIMGLINEGGPDPGANVGAVQGGTDQYTGVLGTFTQTVVEGPVPGVTTPAATAPGTLVHAVFDLIRPSQG